MSFKDLQTIYRPFSLGGHVESQKNQKLCFCPPTRKFSARLGGQKTKLFILLRPNMAARISPLHVKRRDPGNEVVVADNGLVTDESV